jgi:hypothetical protein
MINKILLLSTIGFICFVTTTVAQTYIQDKTTIKNTKVIFNYNENKGGEPARPSLTIQYKDGFKMFDLVMPNCEGDYEWCLRNKDNEDIAYLKLNFNSNRTIMFGNIKYDKLLDQETNKQEIINHLSLLEGTFIKLK